MTSTLTCPTCGDRLVADQGDTFRCREGHSYTVAGLALTTNIAALRALWIAIRALEDDAASLTYMAAQYGDGMGMSAKDRRTEADAATVAAEMLREHAHRAQQRLDALSTAPSAATQDGVQPGPNG